MFSESEYVQRLRCNLSSGPDVRQGDTVPGQSFVLTIPHKSLRYRTANTRGNKACLSPLLPSSLVQPDLGSKRRDNLLFSPSTRERRIGMKFQAGDSKRNSRILRHSEARNTLNYGTSKSCGKVNALSFFFENQFTEIVEKDRYVGKGCSCMKILRNSKKRIST